MNGIFAKIGNWYEEGYVVLQCLRMLAGRVDAVTWEATGENEKGIDLWIVERGERIAIQCKTKSKGAWTKSELQTPFGWAEHHLLRTDPDRADRYRFVSDAPAVAAWRSLVDPGLVERIEIRTVDASTVETEIVDLASLLAARDETGLIHALGKLAHGSLKETITPQRIHDHLRAANVALRESLDRDSFATILQELRKRFLLRLDHDRKPISERIPREEVSAVLEALKDPRRGRQILVHAEGGAGKSQILGMVVDELERWRIATLVVRADEVETLATTGDLPDDPIVDLRRFAGEERAVLVIDQLDQLAHAGASSQVALMRITKWLRAAKGLIDIVLGCRTVDAMHASQLGVLLDRDLVRVKVGELPESVPQRLLAARGVPFVDLGREVQRFSRNPAVLKCMLGLAKHLPQGIWRQARTSFEIIDDWWQVVEAPYHGAASRVVDRLVDVMERDGITEVDRDVVGGDDRGTLDALVSEGVLIATTGRIRFAHQVHFDVRLSRRWRDYGSFDELLRAFGDTSRQDLYEARQLRLTVPRWRGARGARILSALMRSESVRPLLKHAVLLGLAELDGEVDEEIGKVVLGWLGDDTFPFDVLALTIHANVHWFDYLERRDWFRGEWERCVGKLQRRHAILRVFGAFVTRRNPEIARHLQNWMAGDENLLARARFLFWQDLTEDSDEFFELRMLLSEDTTAWRIGSFAKIVASNPERALRLLQKRLSYLPRKLLIHGHARQVGIGWPEPADVPARFCELGLRAYEQLEAWWRSLEIGELGSVVGDVDESELARVIETLARCMARAIQRREIDWRGFLDRLPNPLRELDCWLLLETGAKLTEADADIADVAVEWFITNPYAATLEVGYGAFEHPEFALASRFIKTLSPRISDRRFEQLEDFLIRHPGDWNAAAEKWRGEERKFNVIGAFGYVAYRLLPALPDSRLSPSGRGRLYSMIEKFGSTYGTPVPRVSSRSGWPRSPIPISVAATWSFDVWRKKFLEASEHRSPESTPKGLEAHDQGTLVQLLVGLAQTRLDHVYSLALDLRDARSALRHPLRLRIAESVASIQQRRPDGNFAAFKLTTAQVEALLEPFFGFLGPVVTPIVNSIIDMRASESWSATILEDLALRSRTGSPRSLEVLAAIAAHHESARPCVLDLAGEFVDHSNPNFRDAVVRAAMGCYDTDVVRATRLTLTVIESDGGATEDPQNRAHVLAFLLWRQQDSDLRDRALNAFERLLIDVDDSNAHAGPQYYMQLVAADRIASDRARAVFERSPSARRSAAEFVSHELDSPLPSEAIRNWAIEFANDEDPRVRELLFSGLARPRAAKQLDDPTFRRRLLDSRGVKDDTCRGQLIRALDERAELEPVAETILAVASGFAKDSAGSPTDDSWERDQARQAMAAQLFRLIEECERKGNGFVRKRVLDLLDQLILDGMDSMSDELTARTR